MRHLILFLAGILQIVGALAAGYVILRLTEGLPPYGAQEELLLGLGGIVLLVVGQGVADACRK
jgi:hypothetical protein